MGVGNLASHTRGEASPPMPADVERETMTSVAFRRPPEVSHVLQSLDAEIA